MRKQEPSPIAQRLEHLKTVAKDAGVKLTHQRLEIFAELAATDAHPDAETLFRAVQSRVPTVSLDTVYRTLWKLHDLGLVTTVGPKRVSVRFDANLAPHHHFVCVRCGLVRDFASEKLNALRVPETVSEMGTVLNAHVEVRGICSACQKPKKKNAATAANALSKTPRTKS
ncbi:MAG: Fur family transcriptional regulator [Deltaproteobacteria bacterium]|nr:Fur family transcriptional regulator [Deltaproteobacteria bacterium]